MAILDRVCSKLDRENLFNKYLATFIDQEKEGIIERFDVSQKNYQNFILLPYLQIIRKGPQITTKIRAVFNCSLKTKGNYSLNKASYKAINLMIDLLEF